MRTIRFPLLALGLGFAVVAQGAVAEQATGGDAAGFEQKVQACGACHGEKGAKPIMPEYPILAGQHGDYLAQALRDYRDGRREHAIMSLQVKAQQLTDSDIEALAGYFSQQESPLHTLRK